MSHNIILTLTIGLTAALLLGYITQRLRLSPILGYLLAGVLIGPLTPGVVVDQDAAMQFAEIGVILLMFGVGLHFDLKDLLAVRKIAITGALFQIAAATLFAMVSIHAAGSTWTTGFVVGVAISVASTVVLIRVLTDNNVLDTERGTIAVGWLIVEDLFTIFALVVLPSLAAIVKGEDASTGTIVATLGLAAIRVAVLCLLILGGGRRVIPWILGKVAQTRQRELFTLTVLVMALAIATGSAAAFEVSMALGAFLAGMVVGQSEVSHQAAADALPMQDAFAVLFFVSVGMLFDYTAMRDHPGLFAEILMVVLIVKPLAAIAIVWFLGYSPLAALTIAVALAQVGEFSFIVADLALKQGLMEPFHRSLLVATSIISITLNPILFRGIAPLERWLKARPALWRRLQQRSESRVAIRGLETLVVDDADQDRSRAVIIGYGPVGRVCASILRDFDFIPAIIDLNIDTVRSLLARGETAIYGDASNRDILKAAGISQAKYLLLTIPELSTRTLIVIAARELNPDLKIFVRARYVGERAWLEEIGVTEVAYEEAEAACGLGSLLLHEVGATNEQIEAEMVRIRRGFAVRPEDRESSSPGH
ncbi:Inner membrane protein YbaL [Caulifigura coniformis]|uniref:Inner membrane protein YbaL n=1 Tax=Caulifigura coniformis TaxID=2527983 RepID=A0A517SKF5_9PLAN|nr:cation:proton antiporter [Caulifigura coniformis]QDT56609.1 Inner membrane protein YbaL [Caulifigura coniformis]